MKNKKINIFVNGQYIRSSRKYATCKAAELAILTAGRIRWAGLEHATTGRLDEMTITPDDNIKAHFAD